MLTLLYTRMKGSLIIGLFHSSHGMITWAFPVLFLIRLLTPFIRKTSSGTRNWITASGPGSLNPNQKKPTQILALLLRMAEKLTMSLKDAVSYQPHLSSACTRYAISHNPSLINKRQGVLPPTCPVTPCHQLPGYANTRDAQSRYLQFITQPGWWWCACCQWHTKWLWAWAVHTGNQRSADLNSVAKHEIWRHLDEQFDMDLTSRHVTINTTIDGTLLSLAWLSGWALEVELWMLYLLLHSCLVPSNTPFVAFPRLILLISILSPQEPFLHW